MTFKIHAPETAPEKSRDVLKAAREKFGFVPNALGEIAESPALLKGYWELSEAARLGRFSPIESQIVEMTVSWLNDCGYCVAAHSVISEKSGIARDVIEALRDGKQLKEPKYEALRLFTQSVMKKMGRADDADVAAFTKAGYTHEHVMEVVLHLSMTLITNYVNHIARTPLDKPFESWRFEEGKRDARKTHAA